MWTDTHCHVNDEKFAHDRDAALSRARDAGVTTLIEIAESPDMWDAAVALAESTPTIYAALGIHPHYAHTYGPAEWTALSTQLRELMKHPKVVAVGEFGLDYHRMQNTKEQQDYLFCRQLELAREAGMPIVIHCRDAQEHPQAGPAQKDIQKRLAEFFPETSGALDCPRPNGVIHCFSGGWPDAQTYLLHGFMLGFDGPVTYPSAKLLQQVVRQMPLERIVLETDSPYLPPQSQRGQRNEPHAIAVIGREIAALKNKPSEDVARVTSANARALFRLS